MTHPFHPLAGREFPFMAVQQTWRQDRVFFLGDDATVTSLPTSWTDLAAPDVFVAMSAGRSAFRVVDLLALAGIIDGIRGERVLGEFCRPCSADFAT